MRIVCSVVGILIACSVACGGETPANTMTKIHDEKAGGTIGAIVYEPNLKGMILYGYPAKDSKFEVDLFVPAEKAWKGQVPKGAHMSRGGCFTLWKGGRPMLPAINREYWLAGQACYVPTVKKMLYFAGGSTFYYDPTKKAFEDLKIPLDKAPPDVMLGSMAWDPVKKRVILFGGGYISAYKRRPASGKAGPIGEPWTPTKWNMEERRATWGFDPVKKAWSKIVTGSERLRELHKTCTELYWTRIPDLFGSVRGIAFEYGDVVSGKKPAALAEDAGKFATEVETLAKALSACEGLTDAYEKEQAPKAAAELEKAKASLEAGKAALSDGDGWKALRAIEKARWEIFEASEVIAPSPLPRYYSGMVTDTKNNLLVLFAGHGCNKALADTWIFDPAKDQWRRSRSKAHPSFESIPTLSFDPEHGVVLNLRGWIFDAAKDEWKAIKISGLKQGRKWLLHPWNTMAYDPVGKRHVLMSASHGTYGGFGPRRTFFLKLDPAKAVAPTKPGGPEWRWLNKKYEESWKHLPKDKASYQAMKAKQKAFLDGLPVNKWVKLRAPYNCQNRGYGSFCLDWDRGQLVNWGGGHSAYMGNEFSQYDIKSNRWMESWAPDLPPWPFGAPDGDGWNPPMYHKKGSAHGYHHYVYNADLKKVAFYAGSLFYDVDRMRWTSESIKQTGKGARGYTVAMSGAKGILSCAGRYYRGGPFGAWKADMEAKTLSMIPGSGPPFAANDRAKAVFDTKRKRILWYGCKDKSSGRDCNQLYVLPLDKGKWEKITPTVEPSGTKQPKMSAWGNCYSGKHDMMLILPGNKGSGTWIYDCEKNVLKKFGPDPVTRQGTCGVVYDAKNDVFIALETGSYGTGPVSLHYMRYKP